MSSQVAGGYLGGSRVQGLLPVELGWTAVLTLGVSTHLKLSESHSLGVLVEASLSGWDKVLTQSSPQRMGDGAETLKLLIVLDLSGDQPHPGASLDLIMTPITREIPRDLGALCQTPESKIKYQNKRNSQHP